MLGAPGEQPRFHVLVLDVVPRLYLPIRLARFAVPFPFLGVLLHRAFTRAATLECVFG
jgi:hypothetical protein